MHADRRRPLIPPRPTSAFASRVAKGNVKRNTRPEVRLRSALHRAGMRFRKHYRVSLPGRRAPECDIVFPRQRVAVLVDGCFWHQCPQHSNVPVANAAYWVPKLRRNVDRDRRTDAALADAGWIVIRVWEHQDPAEAAEQVAGVVLLRSIEERSTRSESRRWHV